MDRIWHAIRTRPVRVVEAALGLAAALGYALAPEAHDQVLTLVATVAAILGLEAAQKRTTSLAAPKDGDGLPLVPVAPDGHDSEGGE